MTAEQFRPKDVVAMLAPAPNQQPEIPATSGDFCSTRAGKQQIRAARLGSYVGRGFTLAEVDAEINFAGLETPTNRRTGLPLPIVIVDPPSRKANTSFWDFHHNFHPERHTARDDGSRAVRMSRGQDLPRWLHEHYHQFFSGPQLPKTRQAQFRTCVLACAGVIPHSVIDFGGCDGPRVRRATHREYKLLTETVHYEGRNRKDGGQSQRNKIGKFFASYALEQNIRDAVSESVIDQFMFTQDKRLRKKLGNKMLKVAMNVAVDPVRPLYQDLRHDGQITGNINDPWKVVSRYFVERRLADYHQALYDRLVAA